MKTEAEIDALHEKWKRQATESFRRRWPHALARPCCYCGVEAGAVCLKDLGKRHRRAPSLPASVPHKARLDAALVGTVQKES